MIILLLSRSFYCPYLIADGMIQLLEVLDGKGHLGPELLGPLKLSTHQGQVAVHRRFAALLFPTKFCQNISRLFLKVAVLGLFFVYF